MRRPALSLLCGRLAGCFALTRDLCFKTVDEVYLTMLSLRESVMLQVLDITVVMTQITGGTPSLQ